MFLLPFCKRALLAAKTEGTASYGSFHSTAPENSLKFYTSHCQRMGMMYPASIPDILLTSRLVMLEHQCALCMLSNLKSVDGFEKMDKMT